MLVEQLYTSCLAHGAYYIESGGEAAVVDPLREVQPYLDLAAERGAKIKYILETHFHADFVSGHLTLSEKTGAPVVFGPTAQPGFDAFIAEDGQQLKLGDLIIEVLHTPGHTLESSTFLLRNADGNPSAIFSGDTLFLGDVGRPDLAQKAAGMTQEELAWVLFDSLRNKILPLPDEVVVYPGHGAGSACGKQMRAETVGTLGEEKRTNYALRADMTREEFIQEVTAGLLPPPGYFPMNAGLNKQGYPAFDHVLAKSNTPLSSPAFEAAVAESGALVLDVRSTQSFIKGHVPGSLFVGLDGDFAPWVGALVVDVAQPILLVADPDRVEEAITRLARIGFDGVLGYLQDGVEAWRASGRPVHQVQAVSPEVVAFPDEGEGLPVIDVRREAEWTSAHLLGSTNIPLVEVAQRMAELPQGPFYVHCAAGYRSLIALSLMRRAGVEAGIQVHEGFEGLQAVKADVVQGACTQQAN